MPQLALTILKYLFLSLIFLFLARAVRAMYLEINGPRTPRTPGAPTQATATRTNAKGAKTPDKLVVVSAGATRAYDLGDELIMGRSAKCHVVINDTYASQVHSRVFRRNGQFFIEDMGSTNGTYLNNAKVMVPTPVSRGDRARIGRTEMEFRK